MSNTKFVIDTSVLSLAYYPNPNQDLATEILERAGQGQLMLAAPNLIYYELLSVFSKVMPDEATAWKFFGQFQDMREAGFIEIVDGAHLYEQVNRLAFLKSLNGPVSSFDASFHALAINLDYVFLTADKRHYNKTHDRLGHIMLLEDLRFEN